MADNFDEQQVKLESPAVESDDVTPHDSTELDPIPRGFYVGVSGDVVLRLKDDAADRTFKNMAQGVLHAMRPKLIKATGTTATDIIVVY